jgi:type IV pilus assembly protein PilA
VRGGSGERHGDDASAAVASKTVRAAAQIRERGGGTALAPSPGMRTHRGSAAGFTLIELLTVLAIVGTLAAIAIPQFSGQQAAALNARVVNDTRNAALAEEAYYDTAGEYVEGDCGSLPGMAVSPGVVCTAVVENGGIDFRVTARHPSATRVCTWDSATVPSLTCS